MVFSSLAASCRCCSENPLIPVVQISAATSVSVTIGWRAKDDPSAAKRELQGHSVGRKTRRDGSAETVAATFPAVGGISYSPHWQQIKRDAGCNKDDQLIASDFRRFCKEKGIPLDSQNIEKAFSGFCTKVGKV